MVRPMLLIFLAAAACGKGSAPSPEASQSAAERLERLQNEEGDVVARRAELVRERKEVDTERAVLDEKRRKVVASGGDLQGVESELAALREREARLQLEEQNLGQKLETLLRSYREVSVGGGGKDIAAREAQMAVREKDLARRETGLAARETTLADRERELARRERETCSAPLAVAAPAAAPAARYGRKDVEPLLSAARRQMGDKGLLPSDLPAPARELEREAAAAMSGGDFARARFAADQLVATVDSVKVDKAFIIAKIGRLNGAVKGAKLADDAQRQVDDLFRDATADYGDGKFASANGKLNRIYSLIR